jgi:uncharacterized repeat protein (TIGR01451 family)
VGDTNKNGLLDPGETWLFTSAGVLTQQARLGVHVNIATVTAQSVQNHVSVSDTDPAYYTGVVPQPAVSLVKTAHIEGDETQGVDSTSDDIVYTITVTNTGNVDLSSVAVQDTLGNNLPQLLGTPTSHPSWVSIQQIGGISGNDTLETGEAWIYTYVHNVTQADLDRLAPGNFMFGGTPAQLPPGGANGALFFSGTDLPATGSGLIDPFVRLQAKDTEQGYNTDARPYDANNNAGATATFNHSIQLAEVPLVDVAGVLYREFRLDLNEANNGGKTNLISLDALKLFSAATGNLSGLNTTVGTVGATNAFSSGPSTLLYNLDGAGNISVGLTDWSTGSGHGDYAVMIPQSAFVNVADNQFIYLYSAFGKSHGTDGGFEEWYVRRPVSIDNTATVTASSVPPLGQSVTVSATDSVSVPLIQDPATLLQIEAAPAPATPNSVINLTNDQLGPIVAEAKQLWINALGAGDPRLSALNSVSIAVGDLGPGLLGETTGGAILIDRNAAGWGWFVDPTPRDNSEFSIVLSSGVYAATPGSPAYGRMDLLSTVVHELGNVMGFAEDPGQDVTGATLQAGMRRIPVASAVLSVTTAANGSLSLSNVPPVFEPPITMAAGFNVSSSNGNGFGPTIALGLPTSSLPGTALSVVLASEPPKPGSFVNIDPSLTANLGDNLSGPSTVPPFATGPEPSPAEHHSRPANTSGARPGAGEALTIDWSGTGALDQLDSSKDSHDSQDWVEDFLNHLGQNATQRNPNAGISVRPTAAGAHAPL